MELKTTITNKNVITLCDKEEKCPIGEQKPTSHGDASILDNPPENTKIDIQAGKIKNW